MGMFKIRIDNTQIPFSFYQLSSDIATLNISATNPLSETKLGTITLTAGNYTALTALVELKSKIETFCNTAGVGYTPFLPTLTFDYSRDTGHTTFQTNTGSITLFFSTNQALGNFYGFDIDMTFSSIASATSNQYTVVNPVSYLLVRCSSLKQFNNTEFVVEKDVFSDILHKIPIITSQNTWIQHDQPSVDVFIVDTIISQLNFYITTNLNYTPIDLQGLDWSFTFTITEVEHKSFEPPALVNNIRVDDREETIQSLEQQRAELLKRIDFYKKKIGG